MFLLHSSISLALVLVDKHLNPLAFETLAQSSAQKLLLVWLKQSSFEDYPFKKVLVLLDLLLN